MNKQEHFDNGFLLLKKDDALSTPVSRINYSFYKDIKEAKQDIEARKNEIQCVVSSTPEEFSSGVTFGQSQFPGLGDYADGVDTMAFLNSL